MLFVKIYLTVVIMLIVCSLVLKGLYGKFGGKWELIAETCAWIGMISGGLYLIVVVLCAIWRL